jgi:hypothetical protein
MPIKYKRESKSQYKTWNKQVKYNTKEIAVQYGFNTLTERYFQTSPDFEIDKDQVESFVKPNGSFRLRYVPFHKAPA